MKDRMVKQLLSEGWYQWEGNNIKNGRGRMNVVEVLCIHVLKWNSETC
jgi:hypothetical protein